MLNFSLHSQSGYQHEVVGWSPLADEVQGVYHLIVLD